MVKKILSVFAIASMMLATSCSNDEFDSLQNGKESTVTFTAQLPDGLQTKTRAYGDGTTANTLTYAVYEVGENNTWNLLSNSAKKMKPLTCAEVSLRLVNGNKYVVVFWADASESIYTFDAKEMKVTAKYNNNNPEFNKEAYDAFFAVEEITVDGSSLDRTVYLKRPFAQLNIGTADLTDAANAGHEVTKAGIKVSTYNTLNFQNGSVSGETEVTFDPATLPDETFPVSGYKYLTMNYLLMGEKETRDVTIKYDNAQEHIFQNVPLQRNYRTNIYGNLLTSQNDITVTINPDFEEEPGHPVEIWDGSTITSVNENAAGEYEIYSGAQLAWIAQQVNNNSITFNGKTVKLMNDIYLADAAWTPIGILNQYPGSQSFAGSFDGNGKIIYGLNVTLSECAGLFGTIDANAKINNVTVKGAKINSKHYAGVILGYAHATATIENCVVEDATVVVATELINKDWDNGDKAGGIAGYVANVTVKNNSVRNTHITAYRDLGGIVGYANNATVTGNNIENVNITIDATHNYKNYPSKAEYDANHIIGEKEGTTVDNGNTGTALISNPAKMVSTVADLATALNNGGEIVLLADIDLTQSVARAASSVWTTVYVSNKTLVIDGNGHSISGLTTPLANCYGCTVTIKNLTVKDSEVVANGDDSKGYLGAGIILEQAQWCNLYMENCHVKNCKLTAGDTRAGALVGYWIGGGEIRDCSVNECTVTSNDTAAGIAAHRQSQDGYEVIAKITNCTVNNSNISSTKNGTFRTGAILGTNAAGITQITNCTVCDKTTVSQSNATNEACSKLLGRVADGNVNVDGTEYTPAN